MAERSLRQELVDINEKFQHFSQSLDMKLQKIDIARIVGGVLASAGAVYLFLASVGVYSTAGEISVQFVGFGCVMSAIGLLFRLRIGKEGSRLLGRFHEACHSIPAAAADIPSSSGLGYTRWSIVRLLLFVLSLEEFIRTIEDTTDVKWGLLFASLALLFSNGMKVYYLIQGFQGKEASSFSQVCRRCMKSLDKILYNGTVP